MVGFSKIDRGFYFLNFDFSELPVREVGLSA
jgi:hypothetical protein